MLTVITEFRHGIFFVRLKGKLNTKTREVLKKKVTSLVKEYGITNLVINVSELNQIDLNGISEVFNNYLYIRKYAGTSFICGLNFNIEKDIKNSHILNYIPLVNDELNAMKVIKWMG